jgi:hypothetical protein
MGDVYGADWKLLTTISERTYFYDAKSVTRPSKDFVRVWSKVAFTEEGVKQWVKESKRELLYEKKGWPKNLEKFDHMLILYEYNCPDRMFRVLTINEFSKDGLVIESFNYDKPNLSFIMPGTVEEFLYNAVCK